MVRRISVWEHLVYNSWSVLQFANKGELQAYWGDTSDNAIVHDLFQLASYEAHDDLIDLTRGDSVPKPLDLSTVFEELGGNESALWSQLYLAGYLTTDDTEKPNDPGIVRALRIPNRGVNQLFMREFMNRLLALASGRERLQPLHDALKQGDAADFERAFVDILDKSASSFDLVKENSYHTLLLVLLYNVEGYELPYSNMESGQGALRHSPAARAESAREAAWHSRGA